jgi:hypothetical protein
VTERQFNAFGFIVRYCKAKGRAPLVKEIRLEFSLDTDNQATTLLLGLKRAGFIRTTRRVGGIELTAP